MQLLSIIALLAFAQGIVARNLCKNGQRYCGSAFKQFDNAGKFSSFDDETLYLCDSFKGSPPGSNGEVKKFNHYPIIVQNCPHKCHVAGGGENDYCTGEILFNNDERLAKCVDAAYKRTAKFAIKANTKLDLLKVEKQHYFRLRNCVNFFLGSRTINNSDEEFNKKVAELQTSLKEGQKKADEAFEAEEAKEAKAD